MKKWVKLDELAILEDGVDADYSSVTIDYRWLVNDLRHRLISLRNRQKESLDELLDLDLEVFNSINATGQTKLI